jgi:uncharacterized membrane protein (DUF485 family)
MCGIAPIKLQRMYEKCHLNKNSIFLWLHISKVLEVFQRKYSGCIKFHNHRGFTIAIRSLVCGFILQRVYRKSHKKGNDLTKDIL